MSGLPIFVSPDPALWLENGGCAINVWAGNVWEGESEGRGTYRRFLSWKALLLCSALYKNTFTYTSVVCLNNRKKGDLESLYPVI